MRRTMAALCVLALVATPQAQAADADLEALLAGVEAVKVGGVPGPVAPIGPEAFAVVTGTADGLRLPVVAATRYGQGRAIATGHFSFLDVKSLEMADTARLMTNAICWAADSDDPRVGVFRRDGYAEALQELGLNARQIDLTDLSALDCFRLFSHFLHGRMELFEFLVYPAKLFQDSLLQDAFHVGHLLHSYPGVL